LEINKKSYIKRVIALPGEYVEIKEGKVYINGNELEEDYLPDGLVTDIGKGYYSGFTVPENCVFAMGDNRSQSTDCRAFGCIPLEKIEGKVSLRFWPLNLFGKVD
jgi:signal peptidase I